MCDTNKDVRLIFDCLSEHQPDVAILQEVRSENVEMLREKFPYVAIARDAVYGKIQSYLTIASKRELLKVNVITHNSESDKLPSLLARVSHLCQFLETLWATVIDDQGREIRICNIHTSAYASPSIRFSEIDHAMKQIPNDGLCIVAGDFNTFAHPVLSWVLAIPLNFSFIDLHCDEYSDLNTRMKKWGFYPTISQVTYPRFRFRTDQVFQRQVYVKNSFVENKTWGSDHLPIIVEIGN